MSKILPLKAEIPEQKGIRIIVVGGGWSGLSIAKNLKEENNNLDVILIERRKFFFSLPLSNLWLGGILPHSILRYRYEDAAKVGGYTYFNAEVKHLDRKTNRVETNKGWINYDVLVLAPGIEYDYKSIGVKDASTSTILKKKYPAGFISFDEQQVIAKQLEGFNKGLFVLTAPSGIYRCAASPYERACLIAALFQKKRIKGKVVLIDPREKPAVNSEGFLNAFHDLYGDTIEYMNSTIIRGVEPIDRVIKTDFDEIKFQGGAIYPRTRAARLIQQFGLHDPRSVQAEADIDHFNYNFIGDDSVYVTGDCRPMPFSKSASVANSEARHVAKVIVGKLKGQNVEWVTPESTCYSMVNSKPEEAILSRSFYLYDRHKREWQFSKRSKASNIRSSTLAVEAKAWGFRHLTHLFGEIRS